MLLSFAHPDDETFTCGMTVAKYARSGWDVRLICATLGEKGKTGPYEHVLGNALGSVRKSELEKSSDILGIGQIMHLGYKDGRLKDTEQGELEDVLYKKMIEFAPDIVITFDPTGITNNPDHIRISFSTTYAYQKYTTELAQARDFVDRANKGDPDLKKRHFAMKHKVALKSETFTDAVAETGVPKLYYAVLPESVVDHFVRTGTFAREMFGKPFKGTPDRKITTVIDGTRFFGKKYEALKTYASQSEDADAYLSATVGDKRKQEYFLLRMSGTQEVYMSDHERIADRL